MKFDTTLNIHESIVQRIEDGAEKINMKRNILVMLLLKHAMKDNKRYILEILLEKNQKIQKKIIKK